MLAGKRSKIIALLTVLLMVLAMLPFTAFTARAEEYTEYTIVGWENVGPEGAIASVKIDGVLLDETGGTITKAPSTELSVSIELNDGYTFGYGLDGEILYIGGVQSGSRNIENSTSPSSITTPDADWLNGVDGEKYSDHEIYLIILTQGGASPEAEEIDSVSLTVTQPLCGTEVTGNSYYPETGTGLQTPQPEVSIPSGAGYELWGDEDANYGLWFLSEEDEEDDFGFEGIMRGGETYLAVIWLRITEDIPFAQEMSVSVSGGTLVSYYTFESGQDMYALIEVEVLHEWGEWTVTKEPTTTEEGVETRVCKYDPTHTETRPIPKLPDDNPKTGDNGDAGLWAAIMGGALLAVILLITAGKKYRKKQR